MVVGGQLVLLLYMQAACWLYMFIFLQVQCVVLLLELNTDGVKSGWIFWCCVCAFLAMEGSAVFVFLSFFLDRERGRG